ncbi:uncharacterized protein EV154DRAFT_475639 [Mucor mucedo]|uniref:uncharacterized protein n=1 Tax=Mucor mucedo TaxID=29922 RepID=UPI0022207118|nr:uncharacterized protein EV154DRAFT_475639 [Mucor mucedo]KAI7897315.1 hypothetical protein EV154DRAFT_475639 [Mucor mucedo]
MEYDDEKNKGRTTVAYKDVKTYYDDRFRYQENYKKFNILTILPLPGRNPNDLLDIDIRFYLYQTEIKHGVNIKKKKVFTQGLIPKTMLMLPMMTLKNVMVTFIIGNSEMKYSQYERSAIPVDSGGTGIQGTIPEEVT